jgi:hypothetical protein
MDDETKHCVACGELMIDDDHHCDPKREAKIENTRRAHSQMGIERGRSFGERLSFGFELIRQGKLITQGKNHALSKRA